MGKTAMCMFDAPLSRQHVVPSGVNHQRAAQVIAEAYANKNKADIEFVVRELKRSGFNVKHCAPDITPD